MEFPIGDETEPDVETIELSFGRKVRIKGIQTEEMIVLKLIEKGSVSEYLSVGQGCKNIEYLILNISAQE